MKIQYKSLTVELSWPTIAILVGAGLGFVLQVADFVRQLL